MTKEEFTAWVGGIAKEYPAPLLDEIEALEKELSSDLAIAKKEYPSNCIRLELAHARRDVYSLAVAYESLAGLYDEIKLVLSDFGNMRDKQDVLMAATAQNTRLLRLLAKKEK